MGSQARDWYSLLGDDEVDMRCPSAPEGDTVSA